MKNSYKKLKTAVLHEISTVLDTVHEDQIGPYIDEILKAEKIVVTGAGRVGMATRAFAMRLGHMGLTAYMVGDATVPGIGEGDLLLVNSGSGETQSIYDLAKIAKENKARIALISGNPDSRIGRLADTIIEMKAPSKTKQVEGFTSLQPMTTLNEQSLFLLLDIIVLIMMNRLNESHDTMWQRHSNLE